jgi:ABC-2 type transport system permease protein
MSNDRHHPLLELTRARIVEFLREPEAVFWVFVFPVLLALALGIAFRSKPVDRPQVAVVGLDAATLAVLQRDSTLAVQSLDAVAAEAALRKGRVDVVVVTVDADSVVYRYDLTREEGLAARLAADNAVQRARGRQDVVATVDQTHRRPGSRNIDLLIPGLIGLNLMGSGMWGIGFTVVTARTRKLLKRFAATPMRRSHYLASFVFSRLLFLGLEVAAVVGFGRLIFDVKVHGSLIALALVALIGAMTFAGLGLLVAARPRTVEAVSGWMNLVMLPMWLLSGTFFSYERFPAAVLPVIRVLPLTALNDALRAVQNDGAALWSVWPQLAILLVLGLISFVVAVRIFRWQ